ncbi:MAG: hypothetical protein JWO76_3127 [Nocardioides sp.]|nr:hypothetical protein [Nocardioides sp.]
MNKRGNGVPLGERRRSTPRDHTSLPSVPSVPECPVRHCWVADAVDGQGVKRPGLLVEWRRTTGGWEGRVVYAACLRPGDWAMVEEWLPAHALTPR